MEIQLFFIVSWKMIEDQPQFTYVHMKHRERVSWTFFKFVNNFLN